MNISIHDFESKKLPTNNSNFLFSESETILNEQSVVSDIYSVGDNETNFETPGTLSRWQ